MPAMAALPLAKLTLLVGAGIAGAVVAKEGGMSDFVSGAFKLVFRQLKHDNSTPSAKKPQNDYLMEQVNSLRNELQSLVSNRPITIVTGRRTGNGKYSIIIVIVVAGYGYVRWKGWRLPDMMFATRRSLSGATNAISKQLESVYSSISTARQHLTSRMDSANSRLEEIVDITAATQDEVSLLQDKSKILNSNVQSVRHVVQTLESKINRIEGKQDVTNEGVNWLCDYAQTMEQNRAIDHIQASPASSSRPALEAPMKTPSRTGSLPPILPADVSSPSNSDGTHKVKLSPRNAVSASGLKEVGESSSHEVANRNSTLEDKTNGSSSFGFFGSLLTRTRSATNAVPQQVLSRRQ